MEGDERSGSLEELYSVCHLDAAWVYELLGQR